MGRIRQAWVARQTGRELDAYLRSRAWQWTVNANYALAADYAIRLLNRHPTDPLGLRLGEIAGRYTNQDVFTTKCVESQTGLCRVKDAASVEDVLEKLAHSTLAAGAPTAAEVRQLLSELKSKEVAQGNAPITGLEEETLRVMGADSVEALQTVVQRCCRRAATSEPAAGTSPAPLAEVLEPKDSVYGRGLYAKRRIASRTAILLDDPILVQRMDETQCAHCLAPLQAKASTSTGLGVPCPHCDQETYCSTECQEAAFRQYHACCCASHNPQFASWADAMRETMYTDEQSHGKDVVTQDPGSQARAALSCLAVAKVCAMAAMQQTHPLSLSGIRGLRGEADYEPSTALSEIGGLAVALSTALHQTHLYMEEILSLFALLQTNEFLTSGGIVLYPVLSLLNHSCEPNCALVGVGASQKRLVALRDVRDGEQLMIDYNAALTSKLDYTQRKALCAQRHFECFCAKCIRRE